MSYDIYLIHPETEKVIYLYEPGPLRSFASMVGGYPASLNVTYNHYENFSKVFGHGGIRNLYRKQARETLPMLSDAMDKLGDDHHWDPYEATEGNAKAVLFKLYHLAILAPHGIWSGD